ncbi:MAG: hypothetical protein H6732_18135 [Alphaproteobacteria bacterium]|nr:hypothetical protein [Alphaproteobacteria bacterium]
MRRLLMLTLVGCGQPAGDGAADDDTTAADTAPDACALLDWQTVGGPFARTWCAPCHARALGPRLRQDAPESVDLETEDDLLRWADPVREQLQATPPLMPPAGGPDPAEQARFLAWLDCALR